MTRIFNLIDEIRQFPIDESDCPTIEVDRTIECVIGTLDDDLKRLFCLRNQTERDWLAMLRQKEQELEEVAGDTIYEWVISQPLWRKLRSLNELYEIALDFEFPNLKPSLIEKNMPEIRQGWQVVREEFQEEEF